MEHKKEDFGPPSKLTKHYPVHKWMESMVLHLGQKVGFRDAPLAYVVWAKAIVPAISPPLQAGKPHSEEHGSIKGDLIGHMMHNHALFFKVDNGSVSDMIESSTQGSDVTSFIAPFRKMRDGRGALNALKTQHAGKAIYDHLIKEAEQTLSNKVWNGNTTTTLASHTGAQHKAFITMQECADHIPVDVPNDQARVTYLMDSIKTTDPTILAALAAIRQDELNFPCTVAPYNGSLPGLAGVTPPLKLKFSPTRGPPDYSPSIIPTWAIEGCVCPIARVVNAQ